MGVRLADVVVAGCVLALVALGLAAQSQRQPLSPDRASWRLTPGVLNPTVTQETIGRTICRQGWTKTIRPPSEYTSSLKVRQMRIYRRHGDPSEFQEDHLISLELGGNPTAPRNLWPEPRPRADRVDAIENELNRAVCSGQMTLAEAQQRESEIKHTAG